MSISTLRPAGPGHLSHSVAPQQVLLWTSAFPAGLSALSLQRKHDQPSFRYATPVVFARDKADFTHLTRVSGSVSYYPYGMLGLTFHFDDRPSIVCKALSSGRCEAAVEFMIDGPRGEYICDTQVITKRTSGDFGVKVSL